MPAQVLGRGARADDDVHVLTAFQLPAGGEQVGDRGFDYLQLRAARVVRDHLLDDAGHAAWPFRRPEVGDQGDDAGQVLG
ncbi:hypothetical protein FQZ97_836550 [compost metagenome]